MKTVSSVGIAMNTLGKFGEALISQLSATLDTTHPTVNTDADADVNSNLRLLLFIKKKAPRHSQF